MQINFSVDQNELEHLLSALEEYQQFLMVEGYQDRLNETEVLYARIIRETEDTYDHCGNPYAVEDPAE
jgi:hypothetical protein